MRKGMCTDVVWDIDRDESPFSPRADLAQLGKSVDS